MYRHSSMFTYRVQVMSKYVVDIMAVRKMNISSTVNKIKKKKKKEVYFSQVYLITAELQKNIEINDTIE